MSTPHEPTRPQQPSHQGNPYQGQQPGRPAQGNPHGQPQQYDPSRYGAAPQRPVAYDSLLKLTMVSLVVYVVNQGLGIVSNMQDASATAGLNKGAFLGGALFGLAVGVLVYFLILNGLKKAKGWARVLGIILAIVYVLVCLSTAVTMLGAGGLGIVVALVSLVAIVVNIMWLVKAFNGQTAAYFAAHKTV